MSHQYVTDNFPTFERLEHHRPQLAHMAFQNRPRRLGNRLMRPGFR
jgi:hypothetical protein